MVARQNDLICIAIGSSSPTAETVHNGGYRLSNKIYVHEW
jgi:hypothetical protein